MITVISPAKRLNESRFSAAVCAPSQPEFQADAARLAAIARKLSVQQLGELMDISPALAQLNGERFKNFRPSAASMPAAFLFDGDTYAGLEARKMETDALRWAQDHLRILSGLYGILRPFDEILPYRLEMGSKLANPKGSDLYAFWGNKVAKALNVQAAAVGARTLVNCASAEYFGAVNLKALKMPVITPIFLEDRNDELKIVSFWAKKARGAMARFVAQHHLTNPTDLRGFDLGGYAFRPNLSDETKLTFVRSPNVGTEVDQAAFSAA